MMLLVGIAVGVLLSGTAVFGALRARRHRQPINMIEGVGLPHPADSDWLDHGTYVQHGRVIVYRKHPTANVVVGNIELGKGRAVKRYSKAVLKESRARQIRLAVEEPDSPLLVGAIEPSRDGLADPVVQNVYANTGMDKVRSLTKVQSQLADLRVQAKNWASNLSFPSPKPGEKWICFTLYDELGASGEGTCIGRQSFKIAGENSNNSVIKIGKLQTSHLRLDDALVSRMHAVIEVMNPNTIDIIDLGSSVGTFVNGTRVTKSPLKSGDNIRFGNIAAKVEIVAYEGQIGLKQVSLTFFAHALNGDRYLGRHFFDLDASFGTVIKIGKDHASHLLLDYSSVADTHAVIEVDATNIANVRDSGAGVWVNGSRILQKAQLKSGDRITVGGIMLLFEMVDFVKGRGSPPIALTRDTRDTLLDWQTKELDKLFNGSKDLQEITKSMQLVAELSRVLGFGPHK